MVKSEGGCGDNVGGLSDFGVAECTEGLFEEEVALERDAGDAPVDPPDERLRPGYGRLVRGALQK